MTKHKRWIVVSRKPIILSDKMAMDAALMLFKKRVDNVVLVK